MGGRGEGERGREGGGRGGGGGGGSQRLHKNTSLTGKGNGT